MYTQGLDFIEAFFGCLYAGTIAVPAYPPRSERDRARMDAIVEDADASFVLTTARLVDAARRRVGRSRERRVQWLATDTLSSDLAWREPRIGSESLAYLQYTSGSTALPKGVMVTHGNVESNLESIDRDFAHSADSVSVTWLPHFHDMGLVYGILAPVHKGFTCVMMSPAAFIQRPVRWLDAISRYKATHSGGPNFAYALCTRRIGPDERLRLDLSGWRVAFNGAEPVSGETLENFFETFRSCGFARNALYPAYGLAEATLKVSGGFLGAAPPRAKPGSPRAPVGCGRGDAGTEIRIVDPASHLDARPGETGEIWVRGPGVAQGYWNHPTATQSAFGAYLAAGQGPYLRTGDLGFQEDGELFVAGRLKDLIIVRGQNHHPEDIERTASECDPALRDGHGAAFSVSVAGDERLVLVYEVERRRPIDVYEVARSLRRALSEGHQLQLYALVLIEPGSLPKTPSGKVQRGACRSAFLERSLDVVQEIVEEPAAQSPGGPPLTAEAVLATPGAERAALVETYLTALASEAARIKTPVDGQRAFSSWGLDSLAAVELKNRIEIDLGIEIPVSRFLDGTTPRELAATVLSRLESQQPSRVQDLAGASDPSGEYPASYGQRALLFAERWAPGSAAYNLAGAFRIRHELDVAALRRSFQTLVDRHAPLRTGFVMRHEEPIAVERRNEMACVELQDARAWDDSFLQRRMDDEAKRPFDLERGPLLRATLFARSSTEWVLLLVVHHIAADFRSFEVLLKELAAVYAASPPAARTSAPPTDYADYARWQKTMLAGPEGERSWAYWQTQLRPPWPSLERLADRTRPASRAHHSASVTFRIDNPLWERLQTLARSRESTAFVALLAAFQVLLHRRTGEPDILVGCPTLGRSRAELADLVGYFVNPVVLRADLSDDPTWMALLERVRQTVHEALEHQDYPFTLLVERLRVARDPERSPLFQVMLVWQEEHLLREGALAALTVGDTTRPLELGSLTLEPLPLATDAARYDLTMMMAPTSGGVAGCIKYNSDLWEPVSIERLTGQFLALLEGIVANPWRRCSSLPLRHAARPSDAGTAPESASPRATVSGGRTVLELFEAHASRQPGATAVVCGADRLTYAQLNAKANQIARCLRAGGAGEESLVGICLERSVLTVAALLGAWKCGAAYVPLDPAYPPARLAFLVTHARLQTLVTQESIAPRLPHARTVLIDAEWNEIATRAGHDLALDVAPNRMAYVIYTSGSTGVPKGVMVEHASVANLYAALCERIYASLPPELRVAVNASFGFDASVKQIVMLARGSTLHVLPDGVRASASALLAYAAAHEIDVLDCTPSLLRAMVDAGLLHGRYPRVILAGGEAIDRELWNVLAEAGHAIRFYNVYGPTECTVDATACDVGPSAPSIGVPLANVQAHVLDSALEPVPPDVVGELHLAGPSVARGYLHAPDATAARFIPNPFATDRGSRLYRTGDLVRRRPDGSLDFIRRADDQMKVRGFRVAPGEIEAALRQHTHVRDAAVAKLQDSFGDDQLVAYVVPALDRPHAGAGLRNYLHAMLPAYMIPSAFVAVDALPLTAHGKLDRAALASIRPPVVDDGVAASDRPRNGLEEVLATMWARALGAREVGIYDSFFELGGHSLLAMRVSAELEQIFPVTVPLVTLFFQNPTIERLAAAIARHCASDVDLERIASLVKQLDAVSDDAAEESLRESLIR